METNELVKELKECNFPETEVNTYISEGSICGIARSKHTKKACDDWDCTVVEVDYPKPNLSELIKACNGKLDLLQAWDNSTIWTADCVRWFPESKRGEGSSPEIAVARLWLALNKK